MRHQQVDCLVEHSIAPGGCGMPSRRFAAFCRVNMDSHAACRLRCPSVCQFSNCLFLLVNSVSPPSALNKRMHCLLRERSPSGR